MMFSEVISWCVLHAYLKTDLWTCPQGRPVIATVLGGHMIIIPMLIPILIGLHLIHADHVFSGVKVMKYKCI